MTYWKIFGLYFLLFVCSCSQQSLIGERDPQKQSSELGKLKSGLHFDHGGYRGTEYTNSLGNVYNLRYNPLTITNDSTIPIHVQIVFAEKYEYPADGGEATFRVFPLPKEWAQDGTTDSMFDELWKEFENHLDMPRTTSIIEPGEKFVLAIATLYPNPAEQYSTVPNELFALCNEEVFPTCDWHIEKNPSSSLEIQLGLKLNLIEGCSIIPCGKVSYPEP